MPCWNSKTRILKMTCSQLPKEVWTMIVAIIAESKCQEMMQSLLETSHEMRSIASEFLTCMVISKPGVRISNFPNLAVLKKLVISSRCLFSKEDLDKLKNVEKLTINVGNFNGPVISCFAKFALKVYDLTLYNFSVRNIERVSKNFGDRIQTLNLVATVFTPPISDFISFLPKSIVNLDVRNLGCTMSDIKYLLTLPSLRHVHVKNIMYWDAKDLSLAENMSLADCADSHQQRSDDQYRPGQLQLQKRQMAFVDDSDEKQVQRGHQA